MDEDMVDMTASQQLRRSGRSRKLINQISDKDFGEWKDLQIEEPAEAEDSPASEVSDNEGWAEKKSPKQKRHGKKASSKAKGGRKAKAPARRRRKASEGKEEEEHVVMDDDDDDDDDDESFDEDDDDESSEEEEYTSRKKSKKKKKKKSRRRGGSSSGSGATSGSKLFASLARPGSSVKLIVGRLLDEYQADPDRAVTSLVNFIVQSCGAETQLSQDDVINKDRTECIDEVSEASHQAAQSYPILCKGKGMKKFLSRFEEFWRKLVKGAVDEDILWDDTLMKHTIAWLVSVSSASLLSFRHTAATATIALVNALVDQASALHKRSTVLQTQLKAQSKKKSSGARAKQLAGDHAQVTSRIEVLQELMQLAFSGVYAHRYRDVAPLVRAQCLRALCHWMQAYPVLFLSDFYLKYFGWCLNDKVVEVRLAALQSVVSLYEEGDEASIAKIGTFTQRFLDRFMEMVHDTDAEVAASAIDAARHFLENELLGEEHGEDIPACLWEDHAGVRRAAALFTTADSFSEQGREDTAAAREEDVAQLLHVFESFCPLNNLEAEDEPETQGRLQALVDTMTVEMWEALPCLKDWECLTNVLLSTEKTSKESPQEGEDEGERAMLERRQRALVCMVVSCAKCASGELDAYADKAGGKREQKEREEEAAAHMDAFTSHFIDALPEVLRVFQADSQKVGGLCALVPYLDLEQYGTKRKKQTLLSLLDILQTIYTKHSAVHVLDKVAVAVTYLCEESYPLQEVAQAAAASLTSTLAADMNGSTGGMDDDHDDDDDDDASGGGSSTPSDRAAALRANLARVTLIGSKRQVQDFEFAADTEKLIQSNLLHGGDSVVIKHAMELMMIDIAWKRQALDEESPAPAAVAELSKLQSNLLSHIEAVLTSEEESVDDKCKMMAFMIYTELCVMFTGKLRATPLHELVLNPSEECAEAWRQHFQLLVHGLEDDEEEEDNGPNAPQRQQERMAAMMAACKLVLYDHARQPRLTAMLFACYTRYPLCDRLLKLTMSKLRHVRTDVLLDAHLAALRLCFEEGEDPEAIAELAKRLSALYPVKFAARSFAAYLKKVIDFAFTKASEDEEEEDDDAKPRRNLEFLECAGLPFVKRSSRRDLQRIAVYFAAKEREEREKDMDDADADDDAAGWEFVTNFGAAVSRGAKGKQAAAASKSQGNGNESVASERSMSLSTVAAAVGSKASGSPRKGGGRSSSKKRKGRSAPSRRVLSEADLSQSQENVSPAKKGKKSRR